MEATTSGTSSCRNCGDPIHRPAGARGKLPRYCEPCAQESWKCRHCKIDAREPGSAPANAWARGHRSWPPSWNGPWCSSCRSAGRSEPRKQPTSMQSEQFKRRSHLERIAIRRDLEREQLAVSRSATGEFFAYDLCLWCGKQGAFVSVGENDGCSPSCAKSIERHAAQHQRQLGFRRAARVEDVKRGRIYHRDRGICQLCGVPVPPPGSVPANSPNAPQLDHIIPVALGGDHTHDNVRLAHNGCNNASQTGYKWTRERRRAEWYANRETETRNESPAF